MASDTINNDLNVLGTITARAINFAGLVDDEQVASDAAIGHAKTEKQRTLTVHQSGAAADATHIVHCVRGATGEVLDVKAVCTDCNTNITGSVSINVYKHDGTTSSSTIATAITLDTNKTAYVAVNGTVNTNGTEDLTVGQMIVISIDATTHTGTNQIQGVSVSVKFREDGQ